MKTPYSLVALCMGVLAMLFAGGCETMNPARAVAKRDMERATQRAQTALYLQGYEDGGAMNFEEKFQGGGVGLNYSGYGAGLTLYFYSRGYQQVPSGADNSPVIQEFVISVLEMRRREQLGEYSKLSVSDGYLYEYDGQEFWRADASLMTESGGAYSFILITGLENEFFKIRMTMPTATELPSEDIIEALLGQLSPQLGFGSEPQSQVYDASTVDLSEYLDVE